MAVGQTAAKEVGTAYFADPSFSIAWKTVYAEVSKSGDLGFTAGTYEASYKGTDGKRVNEKGKYVCNWKMQPDGSRQAIRDIWNTNAKQERLRSLSEDHDKMSRVPRRATARDSAGESKVASAGWQGRGDIREGRRDLGAKGCNCTQCDNDDQSQHHRVFGGGRTIFACQERTDRLQDI